MSVIRVIIVIACLIALFGCSTTVEQPRAPAPRISVESWEQFVGRIPQIPEDRALWYSAALGFVKRACPEALERFQTDFSMAPFIKYEALLDLANIYMKFARRACPRV